MDLEKINQAKIDVLENCVLWTVDEDTNFGFDLNRYEEQQKLLLEYITTLENNKKKLKAWVEEQKKDRWYSGDAYRYTAYDAVLKKMDELEGENKNEEIND